MSVVLEVRDLTVSAALGGAHVDVLRDLSFSLQQGQVLGLVGESGAGKSMLGRVISGTLPSNFRISGGSVDFKGQNLASIAPQARRALLGDRITFIPQEPLSALNPVRRIESQFSEHWTRLGVAKDEHRDRTTAALAAVRLREPQSLLQRYPFELSGGMCQRVLIAMAFASKPTLIVADEPTTALDVSTQATVVRLIRDLQEQDGTALIFITHDLRLAARVADRIGVLYAGDLVETGPAKQVMTAASHPYTRTLHAANPALDGERLRLMTLPDQMPGLSAFGSLPGCRFKPRCPNGSSGCEERPLERTCGPDHFVRASEACQIHRPADTALEPIIAPRHGAVVLEVSKAAKHYQPPRPLFGQKPARIEAVRSASFKVHAGEFVGIVGESGSGKSTLARLVMGLEPLSSGEIRVDGVDVSECTAATRDIRLGALQMVFQDPQSALNPRRAIERLVTQAMEARGVSQADRAARARALLKETGLPPDLVDRYPSQLSGGQKQRVNIARALCITPRLLVADEIVSGLDVSVQAQIINLLLDLRSQRGIGLLFISHDLSVVRTLCDRVMVMTGGDVVEEGTPVEVFANPQHPYTKALVAAVPPDDLSKAWPAQENAALA